MILAVVLLRIFLHKAPKYIRCFLWILVGIRLIVPVSIESVFSLVPKTKSVLPVVNQSKTLVTTGGTNLVNEVMDPTLNSVLQVGSNGTQLQNISFLQIVSCIWLIGMIALITYSIVSYRKLAVRVREAVRLRDNIYQIERVVSPFILGMLKPHIYVPFSLNEGELACVIAHEEAHIARHDQFLKPIAFIVLAVHWFNPLVWLAYTLLCRDIELSCDEKVMETIGWNHKKVYSETLLNCSISNQKVITCPLAFGEVGVKHRIKNILNYKQPTFWILCTTIFLCSVVVVCFMTNPREINTIVEKQKVDNENGEIKISQEQLDELQAKLQEENRIKMTEPPVMILYDGLSNYYQEYHLTAGTYEWNYKEKNEVVRVEVSGAAPQYAVKGETFINVPNYNKLKGALYTAKFTVKPKKITVIEYDIDDLLKEDANPLRETEYDEFICIELLRNRIYEFVVEWDKSYLETNEGYGVAHYTFATGGSVLVDDSELKEVTILGHIKEIDKGWTNTILFKSDTDEFPGVFHVLIDAGTYELADLAGGQSIQMTMKDTGETTEQNIPIYRAIEIKPSDHVY